MVITLISEIFVQKGSTLDTRQVTIVVLQYLVGKSSAHLQSYHPLL